MSRSTVVKFPVFGTFRVHVEVTADMQKTLAKYKRTQHIPWGEAEKTTEALAVHDAKEGITMLFFPKDPSAGTVAHECWHAVRQMLTTAGVEMSNEVVAYHLGYLVNRVTSFIKSGKA